ncbi:hypothetical protein [Mesorhizobium sp.]|nr:hypothetical protein [Mesorhizobium sp.]
MAKTTGCIFGGFSARLFNGKNQFRPSSRSSFVAVRRPSMYAGQSRP